MTAAMIPQTVWPTSTAHRAQTTEERGLPTCDSPRRNQISAEVLRASFSTATPVFDNYRVSAEKLQSAHLHLVQHLSVPELRLKGYSAAIAVVRSRALHLFCYVLENRLLTLRTHVSELDSVALLLSPGHSTDRVNGYGRNGNRNDNRAGSFGFKSLTSTCIPPWLRFQLTPRILRVSTILCKKFNCFVTGGREVLLVYFSHDFIYGARGRFRNLRPAPSRAIRFGDPYAKADDPQEAIDAILQTCCRSMALRVHRCFSRRPSLHCPDTGR
jgi:hypothetical protein